MLEVCMAAVLVGAMRLLGCPFDSTWCLVCEVCRLAVVWVYCRCFLSLLAGHAVPWTGVLAIVEAVFHNQGVVTKE